MKARQVKLTSAQDSTLNALLSIKNETYAELTRRLLKMEAETHGLDFPDDTPSNDISKAQAARWPKRPDAGTRVIFVQGEDEFQGERRNEMTIEEADALASEILGETVQMRFNENVYVDGPAPHTMRGSSMWIELVPPGSLR
jgi:hypothetical protein